MPRQLSFELPVLTARSRGDFFVAPANAAPVRMIESWQSWPSRKLVLAGPSGAGKTHLAHVWATQAEATILNSNTLIDLDISTLAQGNIAIEDADRIAGDRPHEDALFHLHNLTLAEGHSLLLTARKAPKFWGITLPDLASRMEGTATTLLEAPDDTLLSAVLMKLFADRQLNPSTDLIPYLARRIDRSFAAAQSIVAMIDTVSLDKNLPINRNLARQVLDNPPN